MVCPSDEGTPQGGPLSPILSNILLDELGKELARRGHSFVRYADDCSIFVRSSRAGERVLSSMGKWLWAKLRLKLNLAKSGVLTMRSYSLLGFSFYGSPKGIRLRISARAYAQLKSTLRKLTRRNWPLSTTERLDRLKRYLRDWLHYFAVADGKQALSQIDQWLRARVRMCLWKQWKVPKVRMSNLVKMGIPKWQAYQWANTRAGY